MILSNEDRKMISNLLFEMGVKLELLRLHLFFKYPEAECHEATSKELNELDLKLSNEAGNFELLSAAISPLNSPQRNVQRTARERFARDNKRQNAITQIGR